MEALRTKLDGLTWNIQRLEAENRRLREENPAVAERLESEAEWESMKANLAGMTERMKALEQQLADSAAVEDEARQRVSEAEERETVLKQRIDELETEQRQQGEAAAENTAQLQRELQTSRDRVGELEGELADAMDENQATVRDRDFNRERMELEHYRAIEELRRKWDEKESRLYDRLEAVERELQSAPTATARTEDEEQTRDGR